MSAQHLRTLSPTSSKGGARLKKRHKAYHYNWNRNRCTNSFSINFIVFFVENQCFRVARTQLWALPFCAQLSMSVMSSTRPACAARVSSVSGTSLLCFSLVKSEPIWLHPQELNLKQKSKVDFCFCLHLVNQGRYCLLYTSPSPRDRHRSRMPSSA